MCFQLTLQLAISRPPFSVALHLFMMKIVHSESVFFLEIIRTSWQLFCMAALEARQMGGKNRVKEASTKCTKPSSVET
uniref:Uncharacterized protein n=1 Tax=Ixodes ricinus TaxID=34613 RepID=A0A6B0U4V4_IXORI